MSVSAKNILAPARMRGRRIREMTVLEVAAVHDLLLSSQVTIFPLENKSASYFDQSGKLIRTISRPLNLCRPICLQDLFQSHRLSRREIPMSLHLLVHCRIQQHTQTRTAPTVSLPPTPLPNLRDPFRTDRLSFRRLLKSTKRIIVAPLRPRRLGLEAGPPKVSSSVRWNVSVNDSVNGKRIRSKQKRL
jgi:hypothetical protein